MLTELAITELKTTTANPRKVKTTKEQDAQLAASIKRNGLINPITVKKNGKGYDVVAGSRRFKAAKAAGLATIPVTVIDADAAASVALDENTQRVAMHPADEMVAFKKALASGRTPKEIANEYAVTEILVAQRLALANLIPEAIELWRKDDLDIGAVKALTLGTTEQQQSVLASNMRGSWEIRDFMLRGGVRSMSRFGKFGGKEYVKRGLPFTTDLFDDETIYHDADALNEICTELLMKKGKKLYPDRNAQGFMIQLDHLEIPRGYRHANDEAQFDEVIASIDWSGKAIFTEIRKEQIQDAPENGGTDQVDDDLFSAAHMADFEKTRRKAWVAAVKADTIDCNKLVQTMIRNTLGHAYLSGNELSRHHNSNQPEKPDYSGLGLIEILAAYFFDVNRCARDDSLLEGFNLRDYWTPDMDFFERMKGPALSKLWMRLTNIDPFETDIPELKREFKRMKKKDWVLMLRQLFTGEFNEHLDDGAKIRVALWQP